MLCSSKTSAQHLNAIPFHGGKLSRDRRYSYPNLATRVLLTIVICLIHELVTRLNLLPRKDAMQRENKMQRRIQIFNTAKKVCPERSILSRCRVTVKNQKLPIYCALGIAFSNSLVPGKARNTEITTVTSSVVRPLIIHVLQHIPELSLVLANIRE